MPRGTYKKEGEVEDKKFNTDPSATSPADGGDPGKAGRKSARRGKKDDWDDGRTVAPMDAEWMPWNHGIPRSFRRRKNDQTGDETDCGEENNNKLTLTGAERRGLVIGAFRALFPVFAALAIVIALLYFLMRLWLGGM